MKQIILLKTTNPQHNGGDHLFWLAVFVPGLERWSRAGAAPVCIADELYILLLVKPLVMNEYMINTY